MSKVFKVILGLSLLSSMHIDATAGRFARNAGKFVKAPSMALGALGSGACYQYYTGKKDNCMEQIAKEARLTEEIEKNTAQIYSLKQQMSPEYAQKIIITQDMKQILKVKEAKETARTILKQNYDITTDYIEYDPTFSHAFGIIKHNNKIALLMGRNTGLLGPEDTEPITPEETAWILGHESRHAANNDGLTNDSIKSTLPATLAGLWRASRLLGKGKMFSLLPVTLGYIAHQYTHAQYKQYCELRADKEANPDHPEHGFGVVEKVLIPLQKQIDDALEDMSKQAEIPIAITKAIQNFEGKFASHPPNAVRLQALKNQAEKLRTEQK